MAFNLPHNISLQQLTELQDAVTSTTTTAAGTATTAATAADDKLTGPSSTRARRRGDGAGMDQVDDEGDDDADDEGEEEEEEQEVDEGATRRRRQEQDHDQDDAEERQREEEHQGLEGEGDRNSSLLLLNDGNKSSSQSQQESNKAAGPTWLSNALLARQPSPVAAAVAVAAATGAPNYSQWLSMPQPHGSSTDLGDAAVAAAAAAAAAAVGAHHQLHGDGGGGGEGGGDLVEQQQQDQGGGVESKLWQNARLKADLVTHPLYEQLLSAHISCLRTATPVDQLPKIDAQLAHSSQVAGKYSILAANEQGLSKDKDEVNEFMAHYVTLLRSFKDQLQQHVRVHAMEAVVACWELEQSLFTLTGVSPGEGTGATMSEDEDDQQADSDSGYYEAAGAGLDSSHDFTGFGPLIPTETERTLMERVRHELKIELKQGYKAKINDVREEILRKRRAGKLPGDTTSVLKTWWHAHSKWPYPSEDDKARLVQETGLELKQINNWFINQRKRNWHSNPSSSTSLKNKRKR